MLCGNELYVIGIDHTALYLGSEIRVDGMYDVAVGAVGIFAGGHNDKISVACVNYLDVVNRETVVKGDRNDRLHRAVLEEFSDFDVCNLHNFSFRLLSSHVFYLLHIYCTIRILIILVSFLNIFQNTYEQLLNEVGILR